MTSSTLPTWSLTHLRLNKHNFRFGFISCFLTSGLLLWRHQPYPRDPWLICVSINTTSGLGHVVWILAPDWLGPIPPCNTTKSKNIFIIDWKLSQNFCRDCSRWQLSQQRELMNWNNHYREVMSKRILNIGKLSTELSFFSLTSGGTKKLWPDPN